MLDTKLKVRQEVPLIYELLLDERAILTPRRLEFIPEGNHFRIAVSVIYSVLVNYTAPIPIKLNALLLLKKLFQSAHPVMMEEAYRITPVLLQTCLRAKAEPKDGAETYFLLSEERAAEERQRSEKYVRFSMEILKQWSEYMVDCQVSNSPYIDRFNEALRRGVGFPNYFTHFTMKDYIQFMTNWMRRKTKSSQFKDKLQVYLFLSNQSTYSKHLPSYRATLSENSETLLYQTYSILINHNIPTNIKFMALRSLKDFYQEANILYCEKAVELLVPFFNYIVDIHQRGETTPERYFEKIEKRLGVEQLESRNYIYTILQIVKQWDRYNSKNTINPYTEIASKIDKKGLLGMVERPFFTQQDYMKFCENQSLGKHREPEYIVPPKQPSVTQSSLEMKAEIEKYQKMVSESRRKEQQYINQLKQLRVELDEKQRQLAISARAPAVPITQPFPPASPPPPIKAAEEVVYKPQLDDNSSQSKVNKKQQLKALDFKIKEQIENRKNQTQGKMLRQNQSQKRLDTIGSTYKLSDIMKLREQKLLRPF